MAWTFPNFNKLRNSTSASDKVPINATVLSGIFNYIKAKLTDGTSVDTKISQLEVVNTFVTGGAVVDGAWSGLTNTNARVPTIDSIQQNVGPDYKYLGSGSGGTGADANGDFTSTGNFTLDGEHHFRNFTLASGHTLTVGASGFLKIRCTGTFTWVGNITGAALGATGGIGSVGERDGTFGTAFFGSKNAKDGNPGLGCGTGGGGGSGTASKGGGHAQSAIVGGRGGRGGGVLILQGGTSGADVGYFAAADGGTSGNAGGNGSSPTAEEIESIIVSGVPFMGAGGGGSGGASIAGDTGGNGVTGGRGGAGIAIICNTLIVTGTPTITVAGENGTIRTCSAASVGQSGGSGGGGGGGVLVAYKSKTGTVPTATLTGGTGGAGTACFFAWSSGAGGTGGAGWQVTKVIV